MRSSSWRATGAAAAVGAGAAAAGGALSGVGFFLGGARAGTGRVADEGVFRVRLAKASSSSSSSCARLNLGRAREIGRGSPMML
jgi:hypothetical protein